MSEFINGQPPERPPKNKSEIGASIIIGGFFFGMMATALLKDFNIYKFSVPLFIVSWSILLVIHEFGHALMAKALGWSVDKICIGTGKVLTEKRILGMDTEFRLIPFSGYVVPRPTDLIQPQMKNCLIYSAGPGIELLLVLIAAILLGLERITQLEPSLWLIAVQSFSAAALVGAIVNLIPITHDAAGGKAWSDGLGMVLAWRISDAQYAEWAKRPQK